MKKFILFTLFLFSNSAFAQNFDIYVSDAGDFQNGPWQILKFDSSGQNHIVFINSNLNWPQDILFLENANVVLISNFGTGRINRHDASSGAYLSVFAGSINGPTRMKIGPDSLLYVLQWNGNGKVRRYQLNGTFVDEFTSVGVSQSIGIDWDSHGNLYVSSYSDDIVRKFSPSGADLGNFISTNLAGPTNIWFDTNGDLLVSDYDGYSVKRFDSTGTYQGIFISGIGQSEGVAVYPNGNILLGNGATSSVKLFDSNGNYISDLIAPHAANMINPNAVVLREHLISSINKTEDINPELVYPAIGRTFYLKNNLTRNIKSINVINAIGKLVYHSDNIKDQIWDSGNFPEGEYIITLHFISGERSSQRVIVIHD